MELERARKLASRAGFTIKTRKLEGVEKKKRGESQGLKEEWRKKKSEEKKSMQSSRKVIDGRTTGTLCALHATLFLRPLSLTLSGPKVIFDQEWGKPLLLGVSCLALHACRLH